MICTWGSCSAVCHLQYQGSLRPRQPDTSSITAGCPPPAGSHEVDEFHLERQAGTLVSDWYLVVPACRGSHPLQVEPWSSVHLHPCSSLQVGFPKRDPTKLKIAIENTYHLIWIRSTKQVGSSAGAAGTHGPDVSVLLTGSLACALCITRCLSAVPCLL
jgi:hypothetical protein